MNTIHVDVVSAEESIFSGEAKFVALPGEAGELGIYPRHTPLISRIKATELLGTMVGGYNVKPLIDLLSDAEVGTVAADALKKTLLMFDAFLRNVVAGEPARPALGRAA